MNNKLIRCGIMKTDVGSNTTEVYILNLKDIIFYHTQEILTVSSALRKTQM